MIGAVATVALCHYALFGNRHAPCSHPAVKGRASGKHAAGACAAAARSEASVASMRGTEAIHRFRLKGVISDSNSRTSYRNFHWEIGDYFTLAASAYTESAECAAKAAAAYSDDAHGNGPYESADAASQAARVHSMAASSAASAADMCRAVFAKGTACTDALRETDADDFDRTYTDLLIAIDDAEHSFVHALEEAMRAHSSSTALP